MQHGIGHHDGNRPEEIDEMPRDQRRHRGDDTVYHLQRQIRLLQLCPVPANEGRDDRALSYRVRRPQGINEDMKKAFGNMAGNDIRGQIKDGFPVEIRTFEQNMMRGQASLEIEKVTKIEKGFSGNPFDFDRSKLKEKSMMEMGGSKTRKY